MRIMKNQYFFSNYSKASQNVGQKKTCNKSTVKLDFDCNIMTNLLSYIV